MGEIGSLNVSSQNLFTGSDEQPVLRLYHEGETSKSVSTNPAVAYVEGLAGGSRPAVVSTLRAILVAHGQPEADWRTFAWAELRHPDTTNIRAVLADRYAPATCNRALSVLHGVMKEAWLGGLIDHESMARSTALPSVRGSRLPTGRHVEVGEQRALFAVCAQDRSLVGRRDAAVLALGFGGGLRRAEIAGLVVGDWSEVTGRVRVLGKGSKEREVPLPSGARRYLEVWLAERMEATGVKVLEDGEPMFLGARRGGHLTERSMSAQAVRLVLSRRVQEAGVGSATPHDMRRSFVSAHLDAGTGVELVQQLVGHSSPVTTARYDRRPATARDRAADNIVVPFVERAGG